MFVMMPAKKFENSREVAVAAIREIDEDWREKQRDADAGDKMRPSVASEEIRPAFAGLVRVEPEQTVAEEKQGDDIQRLRDVTVDQETTGERRKGQMFRAPTGSRCARDQKTEKWHHEHVRWPDAGEGVSREAEVQCAREQCERNKPRRTHPAVRDIQCSRKKRSLEHQPGEAVRAVWRRDKKKQIVQHELAQRVRIKKYRAGVIKMETGIVAVELVEMFGALDLKRVDGEIAVLMPERHEEECVVRVREYQHDTGKNKEERTGEKTSQAEKKESLEAAGRSAASRKMEDGGRAFDIDSADDLRGFAAATVGR